MLLLIWLLFGCLNGSILALLQNTALRRDQQLTLECKVEDGFLGWFHNQVESNSEKPIFTPSTDDFSALFKGRAKVSRTNDSHVLTVSGMHLSDAGTYGCKTKRNSTSVIIIERAQVIVLDGNIRIIRQNSSHILCEIDYNGSWRPELRLFPIEAKDAGHSADQPLSFNQSNGNRKKLVVLLETSSFADNHSYRCQLSFANRSLPFEHLVTNVPAYEDSVACGSDAVDDNRCAGSEQTTTTATRELTRGDDDDDDGSGASSSSVVVAISLAVVCFFVLDIVAAAVFVSVRKRRRRKRRTSKDSKSSSTVAPCPDILDRSEENNSSGFARRLPEIPSKTFTYAEVLHNESIVDLSGGRGSRIVASDGTEYLLMNSVSEGRRPPFRMLPPPSAAPSMLYASIDHLHTETPLN